MTQADRPPSAAQVTVVGRPALLQALPRPVAYLLMGGVPLAFGLAWIYVLPGRPWLAPNRAPALYVLALGGWSGLMELRSTPRAMLAGRLSVLFRNFTRVGFWVVLWLMSGVLLSWLSLVILHRQG